MKLKCRPEDFLVEETTERRFGGGDFAAYLLTKRGLGTPEAIDAVLRRWQLPRDRVSYGGLKDRHAVTRQYVTIFRGPRRDLEQTNFSLVYQGQTNGPFTPADIASNRFKIVVRDLVDEQAHALAEALEAAGRDGVPNYFDDQRFGSLGVSGEFIALPWCKGDYERSLWLAIAEPNVHDRPDDKSNKEALRTHWNDWPNCARRLSKSHARSIVTYLLDHPTRYREAFALLRVDLRGLYLSSFQSEIWNRILATSLKEGLPEEHRRELHLERGRYPFPHQLTDAQRAEWGGRTLPLPSARLHLEPGPLADLYERTAESCGLALRELRVKYPRDSFFSKGDRPALIVPRDPTMRLQPDDLYPGRNAATISFALTRGAYATMLVKRLTLFDGAGGIDVADATDVGEPYTD